MGIGTASGGASDGTRANNFGTLRLLAALTVLYAHCFVLAHPGVHDPVSEALQSVMPLERALAGQAVALFFVISGFLIARSFMRRDLASFLEARVLRIFPALWCVVLLTIAVGAIISFYPTIDFLSSQRTHDYLIHNFSLIELKQILPGVFEDNPAPDVNISLWTLPIELGMYGLVAVAGVAGLLRRRTLFNCAVLVAFAAFVLGDGKLPILDRKHDSELALFFIAGAAAYVNRDWRPYRGGVALALAAAAALSWVLAPELGAVVVILAFASAVLWLALGTNLRLPDLGARGDLSYATYLYAAPITQLWIMAVGPRSPWLLVLLTTAVVLPLAWLSWHLVERPALLQKGRLVAVLRRGRRPSASLAPERAPRAESAD